MDTTTQQRDDTLSRRFREFAERDGQDDVLYAALARLIAADPALYRLLGEAPDTQHLPVLLLAALHDRILDPSVPRHALHDYYPTAGGKRLPDDALAAALTDFVERERPALVSTVRSRTTQTNEIGRCAVLRVMLQALSQRVEGGKLALFDFGCSAGLNLAVGDYAYRDGWDDQPGGSAQAPMVPSAWRRTPPAALRDPRRWAVVARHGVDLSPVDAADEAATRWLCACVWPHDEARGTRLRQALAWARQHPPRLVASRDGLRELEHWLDTLAPGVQPVLVNTWVLAYFDAEGRQAYAGTVARLVRERGLAWISAEAGKFAPLAQLPPPPGEDPAATTTLWTLQWRDGGEPRTEALAWSHAHGKWADWLAPQA